MKRLQRSKPPFVKYWQVICIAFLMSVGTSLLHAQKVDDSTTGLASSVDDMDATSRTVLEEPRKVSSPDVVVSDTVDSVTQDVALSYELRVHVISSDNLYNDLKFDVFSVEEKVIVGRGEGADESLGESVVTFRLLPGQYKIVKAGEHSQTLVDFATLDLQRDTDFVIVVDADTGAFRGSGVVSGELPKGGSIAGLRVSLNVAGSLWLNQRQGVVGGTNGLSALLGISSNFRMIYDKGPHVLRVDTNLQLNVQDAPTSGVVASTDYLEASALYAFNIRNNYIGPYARAGFTTSVFPGYLYLSDAEENSGSVRINRLDGTTETFLFGTQAHADDLRLEISKPFAPLILQEEIGANLKAMELDLKIVELSIGTRFGWAFRQGLTNGLYVVEGDEGGNTVILNEIGNYHTTGPLAGASANVNVTRWLFGHVDFAALYPVLNSQKAGDSVESRILLNASGTAGLKIPVLTSLLHTTLDYTFRLQRDGFIVSKTMFDQIIMARITLQLF